MPKITLVVKAFLRLSDSTTVGTVENSMQMTEREDPQKTMEIMQALLPSAAELGKHVAQQAFYDGSQRWRDMVPALEEVEDGSPTPLDQDQPPEGEDDVPEVGR